MRRVLKDADEVAHFWANKVQDEGRNPGGTVYFRGDEIFSYGSHFCMGRHIAPGVVAITSRSYSPTTGRHVSSVQRAAGHLTRIYVPHPECTAASQKEDVEQQISSLLEKWKRSRTRKGELTMEIITIVDNFNDFAKALKERVRINLTPEKFGDFTEGMQKRAAAAERAEKRKLEAQIEANKKAQAEALQLWRDGGPRRTHFEKMALRLSADGTKVETSHGAEIPVADAKRLWPVIERVRGVGMPPGFAGWRLGDYRLTDIRPDGSIVVGCHDIPYDEIRNIAEKLGLIEEEACA